MNLTDVETELRAMRGVFIRADVETELRTLELAAEIVARAGKLEAALRKVDGILTQPASNQRLMQVAGPARQCRKIIRKALEGGAE